MKFRLCKLAEYVRAWMNDYGISEYYHPTPEIDEWLKAQGLISVKDRWVKIHFTRQASTEQSPASARQP